MLVQVRHDLPEVGFVKVPRDDKGSVRVFVNVAAEHIMEFRQMENGDIPGVTPFLVDHEAHSTAFGFTGLGCSVHP